MMSDPIADMLTRIRNGLLARKKTVLVPHSKLKLAIAEILVREGYLERAEAGQEAGKRTIALTLKYRAKQPAIQAIDRASKPGHREYKKATDLPHVLNGYGIAIVTTSRGVMTNKEARKAGIGGEVLCTIY